MLTIPPANNDDPRFLTLVRQIVANSIPKPHPDNVFVARIDHWFDHKWLAFAGKLYGAVSYHKSKRLTVPPFIPKRVISENVFAFDAKRAAYRKIRVSRLHRYQRSGENLSNFIGYVSDSGIFIWFSGDTANAEYGSIMIYTIYGETQHGWYASFRRNKDWQLYKVEGLSRSELKSITERKVEEPVV